MPCTPISKLINSQYLVSAFQLNMGSFRASLLVLGFALTVGTVLLQFLSSLEFCLCNPHCCCKMALVITCWFSIFFLPYESACWDFPFSFGHHLMLFMLKEITPLAASTYVIYYMHLSVNIHLIIFTLYAVYIDVWLCKDGAVMIMCLQVLLHECSVQSYWIIVHDAVLYIYAM